MQTRIDHLVVAAETLDTGVEYIKNTLGVEMPFGGEHLKMGTHNHLMNTGNDTFLEIISVNPHKNSPERMRWFGLDDPFVRSRIKEKPFLLTWVVNTDNIKELVKKSAFSAGKPELIKRGDLNWYFGLPSDGRVLAGGILPYIIQWNTDFHPSEKMADLKCRLKSLEIYHSKKKWIYKALESINASDLVNIHGIPENDLPFIEAIFETPSGEKKLCSFKF